jgi:hypothetical protein
MSRIVIVNQQAIVKNLQILSALLEMIARL